MEKNYIYAPPEAELKTMRVLCSEIQDLGKGLQARLDSAASVKDPIDRHNVLRIARKKADMIMRRSGMVSAAISESRVSVAPQQNPPEDYLDGVQNRIRWLTLTQEEGESLINAIRCRIRL